MNQPPGPDPTRCARDPGGRFDVHRMESIASALEVEADRFLDGLLAHDDDDTAESAGVRGTRRVVHDRFAIGSNGS